MGFWKDFWQFTKERKKWWLFPIILILIIIGFVIVFAANSALSPFIYSLF